MNGGKLGVIVGLVMWVGSAVCIVIAFGYAMTAAFTAETVEDFARARVVALSLGFLPWIFTFAVTRIFYAIETLLDK